MECDDINPSVGFEAGSLTPEAHLQGHHLDAFDTSSNPRTGRSTECFPVDLFSSWLTHLLSRLPPAGALFACYSQQGDIF